MPKVAPLGRFEGFADRDARFFRALAKNNRRDWFLAHKADYEAGWHAPMQALLVEMHERLDRLFPRHPLATPKVFRIHRDVRFSKDKSPYKTHVGGLIAIDAGAAGPAVPAPLYLHVSPTETFAAAGHYMMLPPQLARFRAAVLDDASGKPLARMLATLQRDGFRPGAYDTLRKVPRGIDPGHPRADILRQKGLIVSFPDLPRELLTSRELIGWLVGQAKKTAPLVGWLADRFE